MEGFEELVACACGRLFQKDELIRINGVPCCPHCRTDKNLVPYGTPKPPVQGRSYVMCGGRP